MSDAEAGSQQPSENIPEPPKPLGLYDERLRSEKIKRVFRWTTIVGGLLLVMTVGTIAGIFYKKSDLIQRVMGGVLRHPFDPFADFTTTKQFPGEHVVNILLLGCDYDYDERLPNTPIKGTRGRSDAILVARADLDKNTIRVLSIPRDTAVRIPNRRIHKINAAYSLGGPELTQETVESVFGLHTDFYMTIHFDAFKKMVDAVGGVEVNVAKRLKYTDNWGGLKIDLQPGIQHMDGYTAMGYVRMRHSDNDFERAKRQQEFLEALRTQVKQPSTFLKLPDALNALEEGIGTNMTQDQMLALANFARAVPRENIQLATLPCFEGPSYVYINVPESEKVIRKLFYEDDTFATIAINAPDKGSFRVVEVGKPKRNGRNNRTTDSDMNSDAPLDDGTQNTDTPRPPMEEVTPANAQEDHPMGEAPPIPKPKSLEPPKPQETPKEETKREEPKKEEPKKEEPKKEEPEKKSDPPTRLSI